MMLQSTLFSQLLAFRLHFLQVAFMAVQIEMKCEKSMKLIYYISNIQNEIFKI